MRGIVWFRRDLRLHDNPALAAACEACDEIIPLFVFDEPLLHAQVFGSACVNFMLGCLEELAASLAARGLPLYWRRGVPQDEVPRAVREWKVDAVYWNRDYEPGAIARDRMVEERLARSGVRVQTFKDHVLFEAEEIRSASGSPLQRYSAYRTRWWAAWETHKPQPLPVPLGLRRDKAAPLPPPRPLPSAGDLGYESQIPWVEPGERSARRRLMWFVGGPIDQYVENRNRPAVDGTSKLSPHFRFGTLSARTAIHAALEALGRGTDVSRPDVLSWIDELIWREFYLQVLAAFPHVADGPFRAAAVSTAREPGPERDRLFRAWCDGQTGYPIVDAGMRQLNRTGWMHNRVRMIVASFLVKDLRIDWQSGERYFMSRLLDADLAANNGNWQWCAGTGTDAVRGHRIFNPVLQGQRFDPGGRYIRTYLPELEAVPTRYIHEPHLMSPAEQTLARCRIGEDYPAPIVDHRQARAEYLALVRAEGRP